MIVDDDDDLRDALTDILSVQGYVVAAFSDARTALAALESGLTPFLVLLDLMMPRMSGWEFRAAQMKNPSLERIPVVIVTAANTWSDEICSLSDLEILRKPFALESLLSVVSRYADAEEERAKAAKPGT